MNHMKHLLKEATSGKAALNSQLKKSEERAAQLKRNVARKQALMRGKRKEVTTRTKNKAKIEAKSRGCIRRDHK